MSHLGDVRIGRRVRSLVVAVTCFSMKLATAHAQTTEPAPAPPPKEKSPEPANEAVREKHEGSETELPSVAGRPVRRYAQRNVLELGGAALFTKSAAFTDIGVAPTFGWFFMDYVEISLLASLGYVKTFNTPGKVRQSFVIEPSWHVAIAGRLFWFFGAGIGYVYEKASGFGLAIAPRTGLNTMIGGSGILNLAFSYVYTATKRTAVEDGSDEPHTTTVGAQVGYSVAW